MTKGMEVEKEDSKVYLANVSAFLLPSMKEWSAININLSFVELS